VRNLLGVTVRCGAFSLNNVIGGITPGAGNVISGNDIGVWLVGYGDGTVVQGNYIGTTPDGTAPVGNSAGISGIGGCFAPSCNDAIGGTADGAGNVIAFNGVGVSIPSSMTGIAILSNSIFSNTNLGIDLGGDGVTLNDPGDGDTGANNLQNFPELTSASSSSGGTTVQGTLNSAPNTTFRLEFFSNTVCDPSQHGEGETFLGFADVTTDGSGNAGFTATVGPSPAGQYLVTATATDPANNTSEFSPCTFAAHGLSDARLKKISASSSVVLSDGTPDVKNLVIQVRNEGDHSESIGVYVDIVPPGGISNPYGCTPLGRVINTVVTLAPGQQTTVNTNVSFDCADVGGAFGQTYTIMAAADAHADDAGACAPFQIQSMACFNALANDDSDSADNRLATSGFKVK